MATSKRTSKVLVEVKRGGLLTRLFSVIGWLTIGKLDDEQKASIITFLEKAKDEAKHVEISANKNGEVSLRFRKEL